MYHLKLLIPALFVLMSFSCHSDNDIIAEMKSRKITRSEFHHWLRDHNINPAEIYKNPEETEKQLKQMAVEIVTVDTALSEKFDTTPFYNNIHRAVYANLLSSYYKIEIQKNLVYNETAAEIKLIKLYVPGDVNYSSRRDVFRDKIALANYIIQQIKSGTGFDELSRKYSEEKNDSSADKAHVIPLILLDKDISQKIKNLQDGDCASEPVVHQNSIIIVKLVRRLNLTNGNAEGVINDKKIYDRFLESISEGAIDYIIAENGADLDVVSNIGRAQFKNRNEILFSINGKPFIYGDLDDLLSLFIFLKTEEAGYAAEQAVKKNISFSILNEQILSYIAEKRGIADNKDFRKKWEPVRLSTLAGAYKYYIISDKYICKNLVVDENIHRKPADSEIDYKDHERGRSAVYSNTENKSFEQIKSEWEIRLLNEVNFNIHNKVLY